jgi:hypothetical protein
VPDSVVLALKVCRMMMLRRVTAITIWLLTLLPAEALARGGSGSHSFRSPSFGGGGRGFGRGFGGGHHFFFFGGGGGGGGLLLLLVIVVVVLLLISRGRRGGRRRR